MGPRLFMVCVMPLCNNLTVQTNFSIDPVSIFISCFDLSGLAKQPVIFWLRRFPISAVGAPTTFADQVWFYCITIKFRCTTYFECI